MSVKHQYQYQEIKQPSTIRLLHLYQGEASKDIRFSLSTISLDDNPVYEAISYCWADAAVVQSVICEDAFLSPTVSLCSALVAFRLQDRTRVLWADTICIDQTNKDEKSGQLLLMPRMYSQAEKVLIWLGPDDRDLEVVDSTISQSLKYLPHSSYDAAELGRQSKDLHDDMMERQQKASPHLLTLNWNPLVDLLQRPWFCRKWVVQETLLAREAIIFAGRFQIPWSYLGQLLLMLESSSIIQKAIIWQDTQKKAKGEVSAEAIP